MTNILSSFGVRQLFRTAVVIVTFAVSTLANATIVEFDTSQGNFQVNLYDQSTPKTVENFLTYIEQGHYTNSVIHRAVPDFIVQGGGFNFSGAWPLTRLSANASVINEPVYTNVKGTIAMAKQASDPNSATDQWFFNLVDNSSNLDVQNSGFTVFGQVIGDGMTVVDKIASLSLCQDIPMADYSTQNCTDQTIPGLENFVVINQITIIDSSTTTENSVSKPKNTLISKQPTSTPSDSSGGGTLGFTSLFLLALAYSRKLNLKINSEKTQTKRIY